jgi:ketosteroid isomerase-like protein
VSQENVEVINRLADAVSRRDIALLLKLTDPQVEWRPFSAALQEGEVYRGHDGVHQYVRDLDDAWEVWEPKVDQSVAIGDLVLSLGRLRYRGRGSGIETEPAVGWLFKLQEGRVVYVRSVQDPEQVLEDAWRQ